MKEVIEFVKRISGMSTDWAASTVITLFSILLTVALTAAITEMIAWFKATSLRSNRRELLKLNLFSLLKGLHRQAINHQKLAEQLTIDNPKLFSFEPISIASIGLIPLIGYENLYGAFFSGSENRFVFAGIKEIFSSKIIFSPRKRRLNAFNAVWRTLQFLNSYHENARELVYKFEATNIEQNGKRNAALRTVIDITDRFLLITSDPNVPRDLKDFISEIDTIRFNMQGQPDNRLPRIVEESLVQPLLQLIRRSVPVLSKYRTAIPSGELTMSLLEASLAFENQKNLFEGNNQQFAGLAQSYFNRINEIKAAIRRLYVPRYFVPTSRIVLFAGFLFTIFLTFFITRIIERKSIEQMQEIIIHGHHQVDSLKSQLDRIHSDTTNNGKERPKYKQSF